MNYNFQMKKKFAYAYLINNFFLKMADIPSITLKCGCLKREHVEPMTENEMQQEIETNYQEASHREWMAHTDPQGYGYLYVCYWEYDLENVKEPFKTQKLQD